MEAQKKRTLKSGEAYSQLFPPAANSFATIRKDAGVADTVAFIPKVVNETLDHTKVIAKILKGTTSYETCSNIWHFVYQHIAYRKDQEGFEQIRSPARTWHDRTSGVDCDCYSVFISSILTNCKIPHALRITKYHRDYFQHIYPVVVLTGKEIPIDCVTDAFNYEVPYSAKKDYPMDLQYLSGFDEYPVGQLGKLKKSKPGLSLMNNGKKGKPKFRSKPASNPNAKKKKGLLKKVLNKVNKANPTTVLLRNGILAAMKLNIKNIGARLRWSYLTQEQAAVKGIDPAKFQRLVNVRQKLETIFYGAGGSEKNLKKAILGGKGNKDKAVNGLDGFNEPDSNGIAYMNAYTPLPQLLGPEVYQIENIDGFKGLGALGEPVTLASIGAAMGVLAGIVAALKQIGDIFPKKSKGSADFDEKTNEAAENNMPVPGTTPLPAAIETTTAEEGFRTNGQSSVAENSSLEKSNGYDLPAANVTEVNNDAENVLPVPASGTASANAGKDNSREASDSKASQQSFWEKNKSWLKPAAIGIGGISLIAICFASFKSKKVAHKGSSAGLSGLPGQHKKHNKKHHRKSKRKHSGSSHTHKKTAVALL